MRRARELITRKQENKSTSEEERERREVRRRVEETES
jgi:hypothetical protein